MKFQFLQVGKGEFYNLYRLRREHWKIYIGAGERGRKLSKKYGRETGARLFYSVSKGIL